MSGETVRVVHVEDDDVIREATAIGLERLGYAVHSEADGLEGLEYLRSAPADVVLLDVMLPGLNGSSLCRKLREFSDAPVIMLSARDDNVDVVTGLDAGADDYLVKPVDLDVLDARIRAVLRRTRRTAGVGLAVPDAAGPGATASAGGGAGSGQAPGQVPGRDVRSGQTVVLPGEASPAWLVTPGPAVSAPEADQGDAPGGVGASGRVDVGGGLTLDRRRMEMWVDGKEVHLTPTEWRLLLLLVDERGALVSRSRLLDEAWEDAWSGDGRLVDVHVQRLRRKVGAHRIETVRGFGYRWHA